MNRSHARPHNALRTLALGMLAAWLVALPASALTIDDFTTDQGPVDANGSSTQNGPGILGSDRGIQCREVDAGTEAPEGMMPSATCAVVAGQLFLTPNSGSSSDVEATLIWDADTNPDAIDPEGLDGEDLTDSGASTALRLLNVDNSTTRNPGIDGPNPVQVVIEVYTNATQVSTGALLVPGGSVGSFVLDFAQFVATGSAGGANFADVGAVVVTLAGLDLDVSIDQIDTIGPALDASLDALDMPGGTDITTASPGDTFTYEVEISNTGGGASSVSLDDTLDANTTAVANTLFVTPLAVNDSYDTLGNFDVVVTDATEGLFCNDRDPDDEVTTPATCVPTNLTLQTFDAASANGGTVNVNADGTFTYSPPGGFEGVDTFTYTMVDDEGDTDVATVSVIVDTIIWFVDNSVAPGGTGTSGDPFHALASAEAAASEGHIIRVREGDGMDTNQDGGITLKNGQKLIGAGVDLVVDGNMIEAATAAPRLSHTDHVVVLADDTEVRGMFLFADPASDRYALRGSAISGTINVSDVTIGGSGPHGGASFDFNGGATVNLHDVDITAGTFPALRANFGGTINVSGTCDFVAGGPVMDVTSTTLTGELNSLTGTHMSLVSLGAATDFTVTTDTALANPAGDGIRVANSPNVSLDFGQTTVSDDAIGVAPFGDGIDLATGNAGAMFTFDSLDVTADGGVGVRANNSGTINIVGTSGAIAATGGAALDIVDTTLMTGAVSGWTLGSVASTNSPSHGIRLMTLTEPVTVSGTTTVMGAAGPGIDLNGAAATTFTGMLSVATTAGTGLQAANSGLVTVTNAASSVNATGGPAVDVTTNSLAVTLATASSSNSPSQGIDLVGATGSFVANGGTISGASMEAFRVGDGSANSGSDATVTYGGGITNDAGRAVVVQDRTGGTVTLSGAIVDDDSDGSLNTGILIDDNGTGTPLIQLTGTVDITNTPGTAVTVSDNPGATVAFADLDITNDGTDQRGLFATGNGGTGRLHVDTGNIDTGSHTAVDLDNTILGNSSATAAGLTLTSVTSDEASGNEGINLSSTTGAFTVAGDGGTGAGLAANNGSGGTIANKIGDGVVLSSVTNVSLNYMNILDGLGNGVNGNGVNGFVLTRSNVTNHGDGGAAEAPLFFRELTGTADAGDPELHGGTNPTLIANSLIAVGDEDNVQIKNQTGTLARLTVRDSTIGNMTFGGRNENDGINFEGLSTGAGNAVMNLRVENSTFVGNGGDHINPFHNGASGSMDIDIIGNTMSGTQANPSGVGGGITIAANDASVGAGNTTTYRVENNDITDVVLVGIDTNLVISSGTMTMSGTIHNNRIGVSGAGVSACGSGSSTGIGIRARSNRSGTHTVAITDNVVRNWINGGAFTVHQRDGNGTLNATITGNTAAQDPGCVAGFVAFGSGLQVESGAIGSDTGTVCVNIGGAGPLANSFQQPNGFDAAILVLQNFSSTMRFAGYGGAATNPTAHTNLNTFLGGQNTLLGPVAADPNQGPVFQGIIDTGISGGAPSTCP